MTKPVVPKPGDWVLIVAVMDQHPSAQKRVGDVVRCTGHATVEGDWVMFGYIEALKRDTTSPPAAAWHSGAVKVRILAETGAG